MKGLRLRIALAAMTVSGVALLAVLLLVGPTAPRARAGRDHRHVCSAEATLIASSAGAARRRRPAVRTSLDALVDEAARKVQSRVTLVALDGRVLGDSAVSGADLAAMENHATRPEVREALTSGRGVSIRHSATVGQDFLYVAVPVRRDSGVWPSSGRAVARRHRRRGAAIRDGGRRPRFASRF